MEPFKNQINNKVIDHIAENISVDAPFDHASFREEAKRDLNELELKDRVIQISNAMHAHFDCNFTESLEWVTGSFPNDRSTDPQIQTGEMKYWPILSYIELHGVEYFNESMAAIKHLTAHFTGEFAIRPFIEKHPEPAFKLLEKWTGDPSPHVRRLVSEGSRPRLPWGIRLRNVQNDPNLTLPLLEQLRDDESEFVRRSVSNHINDFSKDHPDLVVSIAEEWWSEESTRQKTVKHALRTLLKAGNPGALAVIGYGTPKFSDAKLSVDTPKVSMGETVDFAISLQAEKKQKWMIDYAIHHVKANGKTTPKVFKWVSRSVKKGESVSISKSHLIKPISTRKYYAGEHAVEVFVNGKSVGKEPFTLRL